MKSIDSGAVSRIINRLTSNQKTIKASRSVAEDFKENRRRFEEQRKKINESIKDGARLTKHRFNI